MTTEVRYRLIEASDLDDLFEIRVRTWHNEHGAEELKQLGINRESVASLLLNSHRGWLAESNGVPVGFAMGDSSAGELWVIAVLPEFEGRGIGRNLLTEVEEWLAESGWAEVWLTTDPDEEYRTVGFYRKCGWWDWKLENHDRYMRKIVAESGRRGDPSAEY